MMMKSIRDISVQLVFKTDGKNEWLWVDLLAVYFIV